MAEDIKIRNYQNQLKQKQKEFEQKMLELNWIYKHSFENRKKFSDFVHKVYDNKHYDADDIFINQRMKSSKDMLNRISSLKTVSHNSYEYSTPIKRTVFRLENLNNSVKHKSMKLSSLRQSRESNRTRWEVIFTLGLHLQWEGRTSKTTCWLEVNSNFYFSKTWE